MTKNGGIVLSNFSNSGKRILNLVQEALKQQDKVSTAEAWANVLGLDARVAKSDPHEVNQQLGLLRHELDLLEQNMKASGYSEPLYTPYIRRIRATVTPNNIGATWNAYKPQLNGETVLALRYCSEILEDDPATDFKELESLLSKLTEFRSNLDASSMNGPTYHFVVSQISIMEMAIRNYPIAGGAAIKKAFSEGFADLNAQAEELINEEQTEATARVGGFWRDLKTAGSVFVEADRIANAYIGIINKGQSLAEGAIALLSGPQP